MGGPDPKAFSGSRVVRWTILSCTVLTGLVVLLLHDPWSWAVVVRTASIELFLLLISLAFGWPARFHWAGRVLGGILFLVYAAYLLDELIRHPESLRPGTSTSATTAWNALRGLIVFGLPGLWYAIRGRLWTGPRRGQRAEPDPSQPLPEIPSKEDDIEPH